MNYFSKNWSAQPWLIALLIAASSLVLTACQLPSSSNAISIPHQTANSSNGTPSIRTLSSVSCQDQSTKVNLSEGGIIQQGRVQGYHYCEYQIHLKAGQHLHVEFTSPAAGANIIVFDRTDLDGTTLTQQGYTAEKDEVLPIRVLLTRNQARQSTQSPFTVKFTAE